MDIDDLFRSIEAAADREARPMSVTELARSEAVAAARSHGFAKPRFRTSVALHFSGPGVVGHDLAGGTASTVIASFDALIAASAIDLHLSPGSADLFLSPEVLPGSTVLHLFGREPNGGDTLDAEIDDTPTDKAVGHALDVMGSLTSRQSESVSGRLGSKLYQLADSLLRGRVDLDVTWTRPRGSATSEALSLGDAAYIHSMLDSAIDETKSVSDQRGVVETIDAVKHAFGLRVGKSRHVIDASEDESELLREAWGRTVIASWIEKKTTFPRRGKEEITRTLSALEIVGDPLGDVP